MHSQHVEPTANSLRLLHLHDHFRISLALHFLLVYFCALEYCEGEEKTSGERNRNLPVDICDYFAFCGCLHSNEYTKTIETIKKMKNKMKHLRTLIPFFFNSSMHDSSTASQTKTFLISTGIFVFYIFFVLCRKINFY